MDFIPNVKTETMKDENENKQITCHDELTYKLIKFDEKNLLWVN